MRKSRKIAVVVSVGALALALSPSPSLARTVEASSKAAAEALFDEAVELMEKREYAAACAKFHASQKLDPALGTVLRLADCFDRIGKTASAWAMFEEAASMAAQRKQLERERMASERAAELTDPPAKPGDLKT